MKEKKKDFLAQNFRLAVNMLQLIYALGAFCWVIQTERNASHQQNGLKFLTVLS
jgi:hypothetical protein